MKTKILALESCGLRYQLSREALIAVCRDGGADVLDNAPIYVILDRDEACYAVEDFSDYVFWYDVLFTPDNRDGLIEMIDQYKELSAIKDEVDHAKNMWIGWDWAHDPGHCKCEHDEVPYTDSPMAPHELVAIGHTEECARRIAKDQKAYEEGVKSAVARAGDLGDEMVLALEANDFVTATELADAACRTEAEYGDCPVWSEVRYRLKAYLAKMEVTV